MAEISFWAGANHINHLGGSGLAFFGSSFGNSVNVGEYQNTTYVSSANGVSEGPICSNFRWANESSGFLDSENDPRNLLGVPNQNATLNIRFTHNTNVKTQNGQLRIYDRVTPAHNASSVLTQVAMISHPWATESPNGSGDTVWTVCSGTRDAGDSPIISMIPPSPGISGTAIAGPDTTGTRADWYAVVSATPSTIGSKDKYGLYCQVEYL